MRKFFIWITVILLADLGTKVWAEKNLSMGERIQITDYIELVLVHNTGIGFGMFTDFPRMVLLIQFISVVAIIWFLTTVKSEHSLIMVIIKILIISGGLGNLINRLMLDYVIDFISIKPYPYVFNIADLEIRAGFLLIIFLLLKHQFNKNKFNKFKVIG